MASSSRMQFCVRFVSEGVLQRDVHDWRASRDAFTCPMPSHAPRPISESAPPGTRGGELLRLGGHLVLKSLNTAQPLPRLLQNPELALSSRAVKSLSIRHRSYSTNRGWTTIGRPASRPSSHRVISIPARRRPDVRRSRRSMSSGVRAITRYASIVDDTISEFRNLAKLIPVVRAKDQPPGTLSEIHPRQLH